MEGHQSSGPDPVDLDAARGLIEGANRIAVLTGAGISTDSGIPDFRGPQGVWTLNPRAERAATLQNYLSDPELRRESWQRRVNSPTFTAEPNAGHRALVTLERRGKLLAIATQNVDGLHQDAGSDPARVIELHGSSRGTVCWSCGDRRTMAEAIDRVRAGEAEPACLVCGGLLKSTTILFGEPLVAADLRRAESAASSCDLMLAVGSTLSVYPAASLVPMAEACGAPVVIVNGEPTELDYLADVVLRGSISEILPRLVAGSSP